MKTVISLVFKLKADIYTALIRNISDISIRMELTDACHDLMFGKAGSFYARIIEVDEHAVSGFAGIGFEHVLENLFGTTIHKNTSFPDHDTTARGRRATRREAKAMKNEENQNALAERLEGMEPGEQRDNVLLLYGFAAGIQSREALTPEKSA